MTVCCAALAACQSTSGPVIDVTLVAPSSIDSTALASIQALAIHASGDETYDDTLTLSRNLARDERFSYFSQQQSKHVTLVIEALDQNGKVVASGDSGSLAVSAGHTQSVTITLQLGLVSPPDLGTNVDVGVGDLGDASGSVSYPQAVLADSPIVYYRFNETGGTVAADSSPNSNSGIYYGPVVFSQPGAIPNDPSTAIGFDTDVNVWVQVASESAVSFSGQAPFSLEIWARFAALDENYHLLFDYNIYDTNNHRQHFGVYMATTTGLVFERTVDDVTESAIAPAVPLNEYAHIVGTYDGTTLILYVNGARAASATDARSLPDDASPLYIGNGGPGWHAPNALVDEAAVYGTALPASRVLAHFAAAHTNANGD